MKKDRIIYLDYLRVLAVLAVVITHVSAENWYDADVKSLEWNVLNIYNTAVRWAVPVFVMISGSLFLSRDIDLQKLFRRNIARLAVAYCLWSVFYALVSLADQFATATPGALAYQFIILAISGHYHMWYIPMIIGLYLCAPIIRQTVAKKEIAAYFLILGLIFKCVIPQILSILKVFAGGMIGDFAGVISDTVSGIDVHSVLGGAFFFVLGYWLDNIELTKKQRTGVYIAGAAGWLFTLLMTAAASWKTGAPYGANDSAFSVLCQAVAVHTWLKYGRHENEKRNALVSKLAKYSFGVYLVHVVVLTGLTEAGLAATVLPGLIYVPVATVIVAAISFGISWALSKIPGLGKWIV